MTALAAVLFFVILTSLLLAADGVTYYAAGERLNAGHPLYALSPGDRPVRLEPPYWSVPLLSPPLIAVIFRPLALLPLPLAMAIWVGAQMIAIIAVLVRVVRDWPSALFALVLALSIGLAMVIGNVNGFLLVGYYLVWRYRDHSSAGGLVGLMTALKLLPVVLLGFLVARRDRRALAWFVGGLVASTAVSVAGAGIQAHVDYFGVLTTSAPQPGSLPEVTGMRWLSPVLLFAGMLLAAVLPERWSFRISIATIVFGAPGLGPASASQLLPTLSTRDPKDQGEEGDANANAGANGAPSAGPVAQPGGRAAPVHGT